MFYLPLEHSRLQSQLPPPLNTYLACTNRYRVSTGNHDASRCTKPTPRICYVYNEWALDRLQFQSWRGMYSCKTHNWAQFILSINTDLQAVVTRCHLDKLLKIRNLYLPPNTPYYFATATWFDWPTTCTFLTCWGLQRKTPSLGGRHH